MSVKGGATSTSKVPGTKKLLGTASAAHSAAPGDKSSGKSAPPVGYSLLYPPVDKPESAPESRGTAPGMQLQLALRRDQMPRIDISAAGSFFLFNGTKRELSVFSSKGIVRLLPIPQSQFLSLQRLETLPLDSTLVSASNAPRMVLAVCTDGERCVALLRDGSVLQIHPFYERLPMTFALGWRLSEDLDGSPSNWSETFKWVGRFLVLLLAGTELQIAHLASVGPAMRVPIAGVCVGLSNSSGSDTIHALFLDGLQVSTYSVGPAVGAVEREGCPETTLTSIDEQLAFGDELVVQEHLICTGLLIAGITRSGLAFVLQRQEQAPSSSARNTCLFYVSPFNREPLTNAAAFGRLTGQVALGAHLQGADWHPLRQMVYFILPHDFDNVGTTFVAEVTPGRDKSAQVNWHRLRWTALGHAKRPRWSPVAASFTASPGAGELLVHRHSTALSIASASGTLLSLEAFRNFPSQHLSSTSFASAPVAPPQGERNFLRRFLSKIVSRGHHPTPAEATSRPPAREPLQEPTSLGCSANERMMLPSSRSAGSAPTSRHMEDNQCRSVELLIRQAECSEIELSFDSIRGILGIPTQSTTCRGHHHHTTSSAAPSPSASNAAQQGLHLQPATFVVWYATEIYAVTLHGCVDAAFFDTVA